MKWLYLAINAGTIIVPLIFSFHPRIRFDKEFRFAFAAIGLAAIPFLVWDALFTARGVWGFNDRYVTGIGLAGLPMEEILFFICIPFACLFTYFCLTTFFTIRLPKLVTSGIIILLSTFLLLIALLHFDRAYTAVTGISLALMLLYIHFRHKRIPLDAILVVWLVLLIPFLIVNGLLTGSTLPEPVVWYNDAENLGRRILTIPVEDTAYGFLLFLLVVVIFEKLKTLNSNLNI
jgi:lycopene cyclase domain-containing protein